MLIPVTDVISVQTRSAESFIALHTEHEQKYDRLHKGKKLTKNRNKSRYKPRVGKGSRQTGSGLGEAARPSFEHRRDLPVDGLKDRKDRPYVQLCVGRLLGGRSLRPASNGQLRTDTTKNITILSKCPGYD